MADFATKLSTLMGGFAQGQRQFQQEKMASEKLKLQQRMLEADLKLKEMAIQEAQQSLSNPATLQSMLQQADATGTSASVTLGPQGGVKSATFSPQTAATSQLPTKASLAFRAAGGDPRPKKALDMLDKTGNQGALTKVGLALQAARGDKDAMRALELLNTGEGGEGGPKLTDVASMRREFSKQSEDFVSVRDAFNRVSASAKKPDAAGDLALVFNYMKILDPQSVVREGEFATAQSAAGVPDQIRNIYNRVLTGQRLGAEQRTEFVNRAQMLFKEAVNTQVELENEIRRIATESNITPSKVIIDLIGKHRKGISIPTDDLRPLPKGFKRRTQ